MLKDSPGDITSVMLSGIPLLSMNSSKLSSRRRVCGFTNDPIDSKFDSSAGACVLGGSVTSFVCSVDTLSFGTNSLLSALNE